MGKFLIFCRIKLKFCSWLYQKCSQTSRKFQQEITSNKKVIAKKPLTNLYEMNSKTCGSTIPGGVWEVWRQSQFTIVLCVVETGLGAVILFSHGARPRVHDEAAIGRQLPQLHQRVLARRQHILWET